MGWPYAEAMEHAERIGAVGLAEDVTRRVLVALQQSEDAAVKAVDEPLLAGALCAAGKQDLLARALPALLDAVDTRSGRPFDQGVFAHLQALRAWRLDEDLLTATEQINDSLTLLDAQTEPLAVAYSGRVLDTLGQMLHHQGLLRDARQAFERALERKERGGDREGIALTQGNVGRLCMALGDFDAAARHLRDDLSYVVDAAPNARRLRSTLCTQIASCAISRDDLAGAGSLLERALKLAHEAGDEIAAAFAHVHRARAALRGGNVATAQEQLAQAQNTDLSVLPELRGLAAQVQAQVHRAQEQLAVALQDFAHALTLYAEAPRVTPVEHAELLEAYACAAEDDGQLTLAADLLRDGLRRLDATTADSMRRRLDDHLQRVDRNAWMLHSAGRFVGHGRIDAMLGEAGRAGFRGRDAQAAVLFSDLRGFTALAEGLDPEKLVLVLNRYFGHMTRCVEHYGGRIDKFIGDAVMAIFLPEDDALPHAERAVRAALFMQAELARFNRFLPEGVPPLAAGIGVNSGSLVAGIIGSPQKRSFTVLGDTVNTASRLEGMTKQLNAPILVSSAVAAELTGLQDRLVPLGRYRPHGRSGAVDVLAVDRPQPEAERSAAATALDRFRDGQFAAAARTFEELSASRRGRTGDKGYALLASEANRLAASPRPPDWDGAIILTEK